MFGKRAVVSADPSFNRFIMQNEGKLFQSSYPKSFRDLVGKNGVITVQGDQQRKLHGIASNMMRLDKLKFHFLKDIQMVMLQTLNNFRDDQVILLQDVCRKASILLHLPRLLEQLVILHDIWDLCYGSFWIQIFHYAFILDPFELSILFFVDMGPLLHFVWIVSLHFLKPTQEPEHL